MVAVDSAMMKAIARAHRWRRMLELQLVADGLIE
jgi:hypothetical protein